MKSSIRLLSALLSCFLLVLSSCSNERIVKSDNMSITLSETGEIIALAVAGKSQLPGFLAHFQIEGALDTTLSAKKIKNGWEFVKEFSSLEGQCRVTERIFSTGNSIRWEVDLLGDENPWSAPLRTVVHYPAAGLGSGSSFWTPWGRPAVDSTEQVKLMADPANDWIDPLVAVPFAEAVYYYGGPRLRLDDPIVLYNPLMPYKLTAIPMATVTDRAGQYGLSVLLSPEERDLDLDLTTKADGTMLFSRYYHRIAGSNPLRFSVDLVAHGPDWRPGLGWMAARYPEYFDPINEELAFEMNGTGAYSNHDIDFDAAKMKAMNFTVNWQASFDFPYMGMFLPPLKDDEAGWKRFGGDSTSVGWMKEYAHKMKAEGFYVLNYFNVTEFGNYVKYPGDPVATTDPDLIWKSSNDFLYGVLERAILRIPRRMDLSNDPWIKMQHGGPYFSWEGCVAMDCGDPAYKAFLLEQAQRHLDRIPDAFGFCIDRLDWTRHYNDLEDDGVSWFEGAPARSLNSSWRELMAELGPKVHDAGKVIFVNNHTKRLDQLRHVDGIFDEFTYNEAALNTTAFLTLRKPALGWTWDDGDIRAQGVDNFFQKYLYMGVYPMCPFPGNDHSIRPSDWTDRAHLDYAPLLKQMKYRRWVLTANPVSVAGDAARVNLFEVPGGYVVPVVYATVPEVELTLPGIDPGVEWQAEAYYPGEEAAVVLGNLTPEQTLKLPVKRGCAMVRIFRGE